MLVTIIHYPRRCCLQGKQLNFQVKSICTTHAKFKSWIQFQWQFLITNSGFWLVNILLCKFDTSSIKVIRMTKTQKMPKEYIWKYIVAFFTPHCPMKFHASKLKGYGKNIVDYKISVKHTLNGRIVFYQSFKRNSIYKYVPFAFVWLKLICGWNTNYIGDSSHLIHGEVGHSFFSSPSQCCLTF